MIFATLIIFTCLASGSDCRADTIATMPMLQCNVMWQFEAAKFIGEHPERKFDHYECLPGSDGA